MEVQGQKMAIQQNSRARRNTSKGGRILKEKGGERERENFSEENIEQSQIQPRTELSPKYELLGLSVRSSLIV